MNHFGRNDERFFLTVLTAQSVQAIARIKKRCGADAAVVVGGIDPDAVLPTANGEPVVPVRGLITTMDRVAR